MAPDVLPGRIDCRTVEDTRAFGARLAAVLRPADLLILAGPLGAGKTALVQGIGAGLGVRGQIASPTFVIARVHSDGRIPLVHVDAYRLGSLAELDDLDLDASTDESVTVVEWGHGVAEQLADQHLLVQIEPNPNGSIDETSLNDESFEEVRTITLIPHGDEWIQRVNGASISNPL